MALWLARDARQIKLRGSCYVKEQELPREPSWTPQLVEPHQAPAADQHQTETRLCLLIRNDGGASATIRNIKLDRCKNLRGVLPEDFNDWLAEDDGSSYYWADHDSRKRKLPINIAGGEEKEWTFLLATVAKHLVTPLWVHSRPSAKNLNKTKAEVKSLRFRVYTSFGKPTAIELAQEFIDAIIKAIDENSEKL
ncbi:MAG: hypothetical protein OD918_02630 [Gammaproteobacteria bacterium]